MHTLFYLKIVQRGYWNCSEAKCLVDCSPMLLVHKIVLGLEDFQLLIIWW